MRKSILAIALALPVLLFSCSTASSPNDPNKPQSLTMQKIADLPFYGGDATSVCVQNDGSVVAVIDGQLALAPAAGGAVTVIPTPEEFQTVAVGSKGEVYCIGGRALWVAPSIHGTFTKSNAYSWNSTTESMTMLMGHNGQPYLRVTQYPSSTLVFTSTDQGNSWTRQTMPSGGGAGSFSVAADGTLLLSSPTGFYSSSDAGTTWITHPAIIANYGPSVLKMSNGTFIAYLSGGGGLWSSTNGESFTNVNTFNQAPYHLEIFEGGDGFLYSLALENGGGAGDRAARVLRSTDVGATWQHVLFAQGHDIDVNGSTIAVGFGSSTCGGIGISNNNGASFVSAGKQIVSEINSIGLNGNGNLVMLAHKGVYEQTISGWKFMGGLNTFMGMSATASGSMYVAGTSTSFASYDNGKSWTSVRMPDIPVVGTGNLQTPVVLGLQNGECLMSLTHYRTDLGKHTNGRLVRISPMGQISTIANSINFVWMVQDAFSTIYARTDNFVTNQRSSNNGAAFTEVSTAAPGFVFTTDNRAINFNGTSGFTISNADGTSKQPLTLTGLTGNSWMVTQGFVDKQNKLYLLSSSDGVFVSNTGL